MRIIGRKDLHFVSRRVPWATLFAVHGVRINAPIEPPYLVVTNCSQTKGTPGQRSTPKNFYLGGPQLRFYAFCERLALRYAIISDRYGLHYDDERKTFYDVSPMSLTEQQLHALGGVIREKSLRLKVKSILYVNATPSRAIPYLVMLLASGLYVHYFTKLSDLEEAINVPARERLPL